MKVKAFFMTWCLIAAAFCSTCPLATSSDEEQEVLCTIKENLAFCAKGVMTAEKVYLQEEQIVVTSDGVHLVVDEMGHTIKLPKLLSDQRGCYVEFSVLNTCTACGNKYFLWCDNPACPLAQKRNKK